jgi:hypothetical protein
MTDLPEQVERLPEIAIKALHHARSENRKMLVTLIANWGSECFALPAGFTASAFDRLSYDTPEEEAALKADLKAIADWRRPIDGERALIDKAVAEHMTLDYDAVRDISGTTPWMHITIGGKWRLLPTPFNAGYAVVPK